jgi:hypothetical protein
MIDQDLEAGADNNGPGAVVEEKKLGKLNQAPSCKDFRFNMEMGGRSQEVVGCSSSAQPYFLPLIFLSFSSVGATSSRHSIRLLCYKISFEISQRPDLPGVLVLYSPLQDATESKWPNVCAVPNVPLRQSLSDGGHQWHLLLDLPEVYRVLTFDLNTRDAVMLM